MLQSLVLSNEQLACLSTPARNEAFVALRTRGQASSREIGQAIGKSPEAIHYHMKSLMNAGLIREAARRPAPKKPESIYEAVARRFELPDPAKNSETAKLIRAAVLAGLRDVMRGYEAAAIRAQRDSSRRNLQVVRLAACLSQEDSDELQRMIGAVTRFADERRVEDGVRLQWSSVLFESPSSGG